MIAVLPADTTLIDYEQMFLMRSTSGAAGRSTYGPAKTYGPDKEPAHQSG